MIEKEHESIISILEHILEKRETSYSLQLFISFALLILCVYSTWSNRTSAPLFLSGATTGNKQT